MPVTLLERHRVASPGIVLDELEKAGSSTQNGRLPDVLLAILEPVSAVEWTNPYLQAPVDVSHVVWIATANRLEGISMALLDLCRVLQMSAPGPEHLALLAPGLLWQPAWPVGWTRGRPQHSTGWNSRRWPRLGRAGHSGDWLGCSKASWPHETMRRCFNEREW